MTGNAWKSILESKCVFAFAGTHERYKALRSAFYTQLNGVILVHELDNGRSTAGLGRWAAEVARHGTFAAPLPEERAAASLGALPVPYLTIANKADLAGGLKVLTFV